MKRSFSWQALLVHLFVLLIVVAVCHATALTANRATPYRHLTEMSFDCYTNTYIYAGAMVALNSSGYAVNAEDASGYIVVGKSRYEIDNETATGVTGGTGDKTVEVEVGVLGWENAGDVTIANIGDMAYVVDNQTVSAATSGTYSVISGVIVDVDDDYVWVDTFTLPRTAGAFTTISGTGNGIIGGNLVVSGSVTSADSIVSDDQTVLDDSIVGGDLAISGNVAAATGSIASRKTLLSKDNTTQYAMESGTCTNGEAVLFTTAFASGTPQVYMTYAEEPASVATNLCATSVDTNGFTAVGVAAKSINWMAVGVK